jgi:hypothetical protein
MAKNQSLHDLQIMKIAGEYLSPGAFEEFKDYVDSTKKGTDKGPKFTADSKGGVKKNYKNGGAILSGRGGKFKGVF